VPASHWLQGKCSRINLSQLASGLRDDFTKSQAASCKHFQCQNRRFRVFEAGYWNYFQILKEQAITLTKIVKTISAFKGSTYLLL